MRRAVRVVVALACLWAASSSLYFLVPSGDGPPRAADAVVVLAGDAAYRLPAGAELVRNGVAPLLVLSREGDEDWRGVQYCAGRTPVRTVCFRADPYSTRGEARAVAALARDRDWHSVVVVTSDYHVRRARLLFRRCLDDVRVAFDGVSYDRRWIPLDVVFESAKLARAQLQRGC